MPIDIYSLNYSPPCRAVLMTAKQLNINMNVKNVDLSKGQHLTEEFLKINPGHAIPVIDDDGFTLYESKAIMQYLCNQYAPQSSLYPNEPKKRALVDRWLCFDSNLFLQMRAAIALPLLMGIPASDLLMEAFKENLKLLESLIGDNKFLVGESLTIADLSVLSTVSNPHLLGDYMPDIPHVSAWISVMSKELPYFKEINVFDQDKLVAYIGKMKEFYAKIV